MAVEMGQDLLIGDFTVDWLANVIHQNGRLRNHIAAGPACIHFLKRMTDRAGDTVVIEMAINGRILRQRARYQRNRIMASLAVARVLDALARDAIIRLRW